MVDESKLTSSASLCTNNIPQSEYFTGTCKIYTDSGNGKCREKTTSKCTLFNSYIDSF